MSEQTPRHDLPLIINSQAQKHITHNEALTRLDATHHLSIRDIDIIEPPSGAVEGDVFAIGVSPTGDFAGHSGELASLTEGGWRFHPVVLGMVAYFEDAQTLQVYGSSGWEAVTAPAPTELPRLSINTQDAGDSLLSVKSPSVLLAADDGADSLSGDIRVTLNKTDTSDTASLLFQSGYSGRAEFVLAGDDHFRVKISPDGVNFRTVLEADPDTGFLGVGRSPIQPLDVEANVDGIAQIAVRNPSNAVAAGAALNLVAANGKLTQFLQYASGSAYLVSNSGSFFYQLTGSNPLHRFYAGGVEMLRVSGQRVECFTPFGLPTLSNSTLPTPTALRRGEITYIDDTVSGPAYCDGTNWRWCRDDAILS